ncbi:DUF624 domain-containing protein [Enterococcus faecalis]
MWQKFNKSLYTGTLWLPRIVYLNGLWLLGSLPLVTLAHSTRVVVEVTDSYLRESFVTDSVWQDFWRTYRQKERATKKMDGLFSIYWLLALFNLFVFYHNSNAFSQLLGSFSLCLLLVGSCLFFTQAVLTNYWGRDVSFFEALVFAGHHSRKLFVHLVLTSCTALGLLFLGPFFLMVGGLVLLLWGNLALIFYRQKRTEAIKGVKE